MISNNPGGRLWVDPDGVEGLGKAYAAHVQLYESYLAELTALRARYANAWGDDDMGEQFSTKFLEGLDNLEAIIGSVRGTLRYTAQGLTESSRAYREADEAALDVSRKMAKDFDGLTYPTRRAVASPALEPTEAGEPHRARLMSRRLAVGVPAGEPDAEQGEPHRPRLRRLAVGERVAVPAADQATLAPRQYGTPMLPVQPAEPLTPLTPAHPAISSYFMRPEYATAHVGGRPLPEEYRLISLNPFEDGSTRVDANLYDSITPLAGTPVTTPDGQPIDPGQGRFFVVKENPVVDPTAPGYQPLYLSYAPDGTPTPIILGA
ncbi:WXG100 family type VII secretion target [Micromonospora sp. NPDC005686]|uniref:WXG100 family type VII secretion target n=1 Tax=unclassified Micromonospora TaxID=2617518 RepID=UPI0033BF78D8